MENKYLNNSPMKEINNDQEEDKDFLFLKEFNYEPEDFDINYLFPFFKPEKEDNKYEDVIFPYMRLNEDPEDDFLKLNNHHNNFLSDSSNQNIDNSKNFNSINMISSNTNNNINKGEGIIEKISNYISNYQDLIQNQAATKNPNHFDLDSNIKLTENTLVGSIISLMKNIGHSISKDFIYNKIKDKFMSFRKANGAKYSGDMYIVLKSTLNTSGIFYKNDDDTYFYKEKESVDFVIKTVERELKKKISKDKKETKSSLSTKKHKKKYNTKNKINELSINHQLGYKICKLNIILDNMLEKCQDKKNSYKILNKNLNNEGIEMIKKISETDKFLGMILCIKFFKNIIENYIKFSNKKKNIEKYFDVNKLNTKILTICEKIEKLEKSFSYNSNNENKNEKMPNLKRVNFVNDSINIISQDISSKMVSDD